MDNFSGLMSMTFNSLYRKTYHRVLFNNGNYSTSKWFIHFKNFCDKNKFDDSLEVKRFVGYCFNSYTKEGKKLLPFVFSQKEGENLFKRFRGELDVKKKDETSNSSELMDYTFEEIDKWAKKKNINEKKEYYFITDIANSMKIKNGRYFLPIFMFSKTFLKEYKEEDLQTIMAERKRISNNKNVIDRIKNGLQDDFV